MTDIEVATEEQIHEYLLMLAEGEEDDSRAQFVLQDVAARILDFKHEEWYRRNAARWPR